MAYLILQKKTGTGGAGGGSCSIGTMTYDSVSGSLNPPIAANQEGFYVKPDGSKIYTMNNTNDDVLQYSMSTPWLASSISYDSKSFTSVQGAGVADVEFKTDGTKMYTTSWSTNLVYQYTLSTAWDISTASYNSVSVSIMGAGNTPVSVAFKSDGTKMYILGQSSDTVYQYSLPTPWVLTGATYDSVSLPVTAQEATPNAMIFNTAGDRIFIGGNINATVYQYNLTSPWNLATASYANVSMDASNEVGSLLGLAIQDCSTILVNGGSTVYQYS